MEEFKLAFLFTESMGPSLALKTKILRSEESYDEDQDAQQTALNYILQIREECSEYHMYLVYTSSGINPLSAVRSHKGLLYKCKDLALLPHKRLEVDCGERRTRLAVVIDLGVYQQGACAHMVLSYSYGCIVVSPHSLEYISNLALRWIARSEKSVRGIDYSAVATDLVSDQKLGVVRYFVADNGSPELLVAVAQRGILQNKLWQALAHVESK